MTGPVNGAHPSHPRHRQRPGIRFYLVLALVVLLAGGTLAYARLEGLDLFQALYLLVITVTTVGYGDVHPVTAAGRTLTMFIVPLGLLLVFGLGLSVVSDQLHDLVVRGGAGRLEKKIAALKGHFIVCGYGRLGRGCAETLRRLGGEVVVIERDREKAAEMADAGLLYIVADALQEATLRRAGIERARSVVSTFSDDTLNVYLTLEARDVRKDIEVVSAAGGREVARRLYLAGATRVISPQLLGAELLAKSAVNPSVFQLMSDMISGSTPGESISQFPISDTSPLAGRHLKELRELGIRVRVMLVRQGERMHLSPAGSFRIEGGAVIVAVGDSAELEKMERMAVGPLT